MCICVFCFCASTTSAVLVSAFFFCAGAGVCMLVRTFSFGSCIFFVLVCE